MPGTAIKRTQTGVRIETSLLKVLKGLAEYTGGAAVGSGQGRRGGHQQIKPAPVGRTIVHAGSYQRGHNSAA